MYDFVAKQGHRGFTEFTEVASAMDELTGVLPGLPPVCGKPVHVTFDGGQLTSDAGVLVLTAIDRQLGVCQRLAACVEDRRDPARVRHDYAEMIRFRALLIADADDCDVLRDDPAFKMDGSKSPWRGSEKNDSINQCFDIDLRMPRAVFPDFLMSMNG